MASITARLTYRQSYMKQQSVDVFDRLPAALKWDPSDISNLKISRQILLSKLITRIGHLQDLIILNRLLVKHAAIEVRELLSIALEMLDTTLVLFKFQDRFNGFQGDFEWLVCDPFQVLIDILSKGISRSWLSLSLQVDHYVLNFCGR